MEFIIMKLSIIQSSLNTIIKSAIIVTLLISLIFSIGYIFKLKNDIKNINKKVAFSTIDNISNFYNTFRNLETDTNIDQKTKDEIDFINNGLITAFLIIGTDSIVETYEELSDQQKEILNWARHSARSIIETCQRVGNNE